MTKKSLFTKLTALTAAGFVFVAQGPETQTGIEVAMEKIFPRISSASASPSGPGAADEEQGGFFDQNRVGLAPPILGDSASISNSTTNAVVQILREGKEACSSVPPEYGADCVAQTLEEAASRLEGSGYRPARAELLSAARKIRTEVARNADRSKPVQRRRGRVVRAVKREKVAQVNRIVRQIVAETETKLIRSAGSSALRRNHFTRIARAVGSTKVILRS